MSATETRPVPTNVYARISKDLTYVTAKLALKGNSATILTSVQNKLEYALSILVVSTQKEATFVHNPRKASISLLGT